MVGSLGNGSNVTLGPLGSDQSLCWPSLLLAVFIVFGIVGNSLVCIAIVVEKRLHNSTNYFLCSLAIADLMVSVFVMPFGLINELHYGYWVYNAPTCIAYVSADVFLSSVSIVHMSIISFDRYWGISRPLKVRMRSKRDLRAKMAACWIITIGISCPISVLGLTDSSNVYQAPSCQIFNRAFQIYGSILTFFIPFIVMAFTYHKTVALLKAQSSGVAASKTCGTVDAYSTASVDITAAVALRRSVRAPTKAKTLPSLPYKSDSTKQLLGTGMNYTTVTRNSLASTSTSTGARGNNFRSPKPSAAESLPPELSSGVQMSSGKVGSKKASTLTIREPVVESAAEPFRKPSEASKATPSTASPPSKKHSTVTTASDTLGRLGSPKSRVALNNVSAHASNGTSPGAASSAGGAIPRTTPNRPGDLSVPNDSGALAVVDSDCNEPDATAVNAGFSHSEATTPSGTRVRFLAALRPSATETLLHGFLARHRERLRKSDADSGGGALASEQKATKVLGVVFGVFFVCWAPFFAMNFTVALCGPPCEEAVPRVLGSVALWLGYISSILNPLIYTAFNRVYRQAFRDILACRRFAPEWFHRMSFNGRRGNRRNAYHRPPLTSQFSTMDTKTSRKVKRHRFLSVAPVLRVEDTDGPGIRGDINNNVSHIGDKNHLESGSPNKTAITTVEQPEDVNGEVGDANSKGDDSNCVNSINAKTVIQPSNSISRTLTVSKARLKSPDSKGGESPNSIQRINSCPAQKHKRRLIRNSTTPDKREQSSANNANESDNSWTSNCNNENNNRHNTNEVNNASNHSNCGETSNSDIDKIDHVNDNNIDSHAPRSTITNNDNCNKFNNDNHNNATHCSENYECSNNCKPHNDMGNNIDTILIKESNSNHNNEKNNANTNNNEWSDEASYYMPNDNNSNDDNKPVYYCHDNHCESNGTLPAVNCHSTTNHPHTMKERSDVTQLSNDNTTPFHYEDDTATITAANIEPHNAIDKVPENGYRAGCSPSNSVTKNSNIDRILTTSYAQAVESSQGSHYPLLRPTQHQPEPLLEDSYCELECTCVVDAPYPIPLHKVDSGYISKSGPIPKRPLSSIDLAAPVINTSQTCIEPDHSITSGYTHITGLWTLTPRPTSNGYQLVREGQLCDTRVPTPIDKHRDRSPQPLIAKSTARLSSDRHSLHFLASHSPMRGPNSDAPGQPGPAEPDIDPHQLRFIDDSRNSSVANLTSGAGGINLSRSSVCSNSSQTVTLNVAKCCSVGGRGSLPRSQEVVPPSSSRSLDSNFSVC